jgi:flagellar biosynthesis protein FlhB
MHGRWRIVSLLPYLIAALFIVSVALWMKWSFVSRLGAGMPNNLLVHTILVLVASVLASGLVALVVVLLFCAFAALQYFEQILAEHTKPVSPRTIRNSGSLGLDHGFRC